jgi:hypothetical protein
MGSGARAKQESTRPATPRPAASPPAGTTRRPASIRVADVGGAAAAMAAGLAAPRPTLAARNPTARLETREAWVLSLVDGTLGVDDLADVTGITRKDIVNILERLQDLEYVRLRGR